MIGSIALKDFKTYKDSVLEFSPGINVITGDTGQGKTNILLGLQLVKDNRPLGAGYIRRGQDSTEVVVEVIDGRYAHSVVRRKGTSENSYDIKKDGVSVIGDKPFTAFGTSPPESVSAILNLSDINVQKQRDSHFLVYSPPGQIATYIRSITKLDEIDQVIKLLSGKIRVKNGEISHQQAELRSTIEQLVILNSIDLELLGSMIEEAKDSIQKIARIKEKVVRIEPITSALRTLEEQWITIPEDVDKLFEEIDSRQESVVVIASRLSVFTNLIDEIKKIEASRIIVPDGVDKLFEEIDSEWSSFVMVSSSIRVVTNLVDGIQKIEASRIILPKLSGLLDTLSTVKFVSNKYADGCKKLEIVRELCKDISIVESEIEDSNMHLKQLRREEKQLMEELSNCPECGMELTEESKAILLGEVKVCIKN